MHSRSKRILFWCKTFLKSTQVFCHNIHSPVTVQIPCLHGFQSLCTKINVSFNLSFPQTFPYCNFSLCLCGHFTSFTDKESDIIKKIRLERNSATQFESAQKSAKSRTNTVGKLLSDVEDTQQVAPRGKGQRFGSGK